MQMKIIMRFTIPDTEIDTKSARGGEAGRNIMVDETEFVDMLTLSIDSGFSE